MSLREGWIGRTQRAVDLVRGNVVEAMAARLDSFEPYRAGGFQQRVRSHYVRLDERIRTRNGTIDVRLGREVHDGVQILGAQQRFDQRFVDDVAAHETETLPAAHGEQVVRIARVAQ